MKVAKFDKYRLYGDYHWQEYKKPTVYRDYVNQLIHWVTGKRILDIGAGDGLICHMLGANAIGIELDESACSLARAHGVRVIQGDACALPYPNESFDSVFMGDVIEHLPDPILALYEANRVLCEGGFLYVTTPPEANPIRKYHFREYTPEKLISEVESTGFQLDGDVFERYQRLHAKFRKP